MNRSTAPLAFDDSSRSRVDQASGSVSNLARGEGRRLIVNADDLGMSGPVTDAILRAHARGIVTSASLMVNMADSRRAAKLSTECSDLAIGLHFNLTQGRPVSEPRYVRSLLDEDEAFPAKRIQFERLRTGRATLDDVCRELTAQAERIRALGLLPSHFDGHQGVHRLAVVEQALTRLAADLRLPAARVRLGYPLLGASPGLHDRVRKTAAHVRELPERARNWLQRERLRRAGLRTSDGQLGRMRIYPNPPDAKGRLLARLKGLESGDFELVLHPGPPGGDPSCSPKYARRQGEDARLAMDGSVRALLDGLGVELISYRQLR